MNQKNSAMPPRDADELVAIVMDGDHEVGDGVD